MFQRLVGSLARAQTARVFRALEILVRIVSARLDDGARLELVRHLVRGVIPNYRLKWPQMTWWEDPSFDQYLEKFGEKDGFNADRRFCLWQLLRLVDAVEGDTAECGVYRGAGSYLICAGNAVSRMPRTHHAFDSFEGLSEPSNKDGSHWRTGDLATPIEIVRSALSCFKRVSLHKGWIPKCLDEVASGSFAFVHVDVDLYQPTLDSVRFFYPRMSRHAILVCDDYGFTTCPGATKACEEALEGKPERFVSLPDGGGFFITGVATALSTDVAARVP